MNMRTAYALILSVAFAAAASAQDAPAGPKRSRGILVSYSYSTGSALEGTRFGFSGLGIEFQDRWASHHLGISGFALGVRKDEPHTTETGYAVTARTFRELRPASRLHLSLGAGAEWTLPASGMAAASFTYDGQGSVLSWQRGYVLTNTSTPLVPHDNGRLNLLLDARVERMFGHIPLFAAVQARPVTFGTDTFSSQTGIISTSERRGLVLSFVVGMGFGF